MGSLCQGGGGGESCLSPPPPKLTLQWPLWGRRRGSWCPGVLGLEKSERKQFARWRVPGQPDRAHVL